MRTFPIFMAYPPGSLVDKAAVLAHYAHQILMNHRRKYTGTPYIAHPKRVAAMVADNGGDDFTIAAALLHDAFEDTPLDRKEVLELSPAVHDLVIEVTDISRPEDGNRACRKAIDRYHLAHASSRGQFIKIFDMIDNARDIKKHDPGFFRTYKEEMLLTIPLLVYVPQVHKNTLLELLK